MQFAIVAIIAFVAAFAGTYIANILSRSSCPVNCVRKNPEPTHEVLAEFKSTMDEEEDEEAYVARQMGKAVTIQTIPTLVASFDHQEGEDDEEEEKAPASAPVSEPTKDSEEDEEGEDDEEEELEEVDV